MTRTIVAEIQAEAAATDARTVRTLAAWLRRDRGLVTHWCPLVAGSGGVASVTLQSRAWEIVSRTVDADRLTVLEARAKELSGVDAPPSWREAEEVGDRVREALGVA